MTEKTVTECDGTWCDPTETHVGSADHLPSEWVRMDFDDHTRHFCPECSWRVLQWGVNGRSGGDHFAVQHNYIGENFEEAHISPGVDKDAVKHAGTQSMTVTPLIDEPPRSFPEYDLDEDEGWHFHVFDHLGLTIIGKHKQTPRVVLEPEEFGTRFEIRESTAGHSFDEIAVEKSIDVRWLED